MPQEPLSITDTGSFLLVEFFGKFSVEAGKQCVDRMAEACVKHGRPKVLLDCRRMTGVMSVLHRFQVAEYGATKASQLGRLALLNRKDVVLPDNFVENVAVNRGMNMKIFTDFDEAVLWLSQSTLNKADPRAGS
jgi:hypothetical protein